MKNQLSFRQWLHQTACGLIVACSVTLPLRAQSTSLFALSGNRTLDQFVNGAPNQASELAPHTTPSYQSGRPTHRTVAGVVAGSGQWAQRSPMPLPRTEMMTAIVAAEGKVYVIGGYNLAEGRFDGNLNQVYDPQTDRWTNLSPLPRGANHVAAVHLNGKIYVAGGFVKQNKSPIDNVWAYDIARDCWQALAPLSTPRGAVGLVTLGGQLHAIGGRDSISVATHEVYDPALNRWQKAPSLPGARDHFGIVAYDGFIHVIGGRFSTFEHNTAMHHVYSPLTGQWKTRAPMPTERSGHATVVYKDLIVTMGGEGTGVVYGEVEAYDPRQDTWVSLAPMPSPRHGTSAAVVKDWVYLPGGAATFGGSVPTVTNQAFRLPSIRPNPN